MRSVANFNETWDPRRMRAVIAGDCPLMVARSTVSECRPLGFIRVPRKSVPFRVGLSVAFVNRPAFDRLMDWCKRTAP